MHQNHHGFVSKHQRFHSPVFGKKNLHSSTAGALLTMRLITCATSLGVGYLKVFLQASRKWLALSGVSLAVISIELMTNPKNANTFLVEILGVGSEPQIL